MQSYRSSASWARQHLDQVQYASQVIPRGDTVFSILFTDTIRMGRVRHTYSCTQRVELDADQRIFRITHRELPGQKCALDLFLKKHRVHRQ